MNYKPSIYNYFTFNKNLELILYNGLVGVKSICKISKENANNILSLLSGNNIQDENKVTEILLHYGYLVPKNIDEKQNLKLIFLNTVDNNNLNLTILPTEQCNFRCKYCYEEFKKVKMSNETQNKIIKFVEKNLHYYSGLNVAWFGGEPLLALDVIENLSNKFIELCKLHRKPYISNITTNGYLLNYDTFNLLYKLKIREFQITIDGIKETHNYQKPLINGEGTFDVVIKNLLDIKNKFNKKLFEITIRTNFTKEIFLKIDEYIEFFFNNFNDDKRFNFFVRPAGNWGGDRVQSFEDSFLSGFNVSNIFESLLKSDKILNYTSHCRFLEPGGSVCLAAKKNSYLIDSECIIRKCSCQLEDENLNKIGYIKENGDMIIDLNKQSRWINFYEENNKCSDCYLLPECLNNSCPANTVMGRNDPDQCYVYEKKYIDYILKLLDNYESLEVLF